MMIRTLVLGGVAGLALAGAATAAVNTCVVPRHKVVHRVAAYHPKARAVTPHVRVLADTASPAYAQAAPPPREYVAAAYPAPVYEGYGYAPYPYPYAYGPAIYGGPYWGPRWGYWHGGWRGGWRGGGHWRR